MKLTQLQEWRRASIAHRAAQASRSVSQGNQRQNAQQHDGHHGRQAQLMQQRAAGIRCLRLALPILTVDDVRRRDELLLNSLGQIHQRQDQVEHPDLILGDGTTDDHIRSKTRPTDHGLIQQRERSIQQIGARGGRCHNPRQGTEAHRGTAGPEGG